MFDGEYGFYHFLFANMDDDFYTSENLKLDFQSYLTLQLMRDKYQYIYFVSQIQAQSYQILSVGTQSKLKLETVEKKRKIKLLLNRNKTKDESIQTDATPYSVRLKKEEAQEYVLRMLTLMEQESPVAVVMSMDIFDEFSKNPEILKAFGSFGKNPRRICGNYNCFILTAGTSESDTAPYFVSQRTVFGGKNVRNDTVFFNKDVFPEIRNAFDPDSKTKFFPTKRVVYYEKLRKILGERFHIWNTYSVDDYYHATLSYWIHKKDGRLPFFIEKAREYSNVFWAWYEYPTFRIRYFMHLPDDPNHKMKNILQCLENPDICKEIESIVQQEGIDNLESLHYGATPELHIVAKNEPEIVDIIQQFQDILMNHFKRTGNLALEYFEMETLKQDEMYFRKPGYQSFGQYENSHEDKESFIPLTYQLHKKRDFGDCFKELNKRSEWNAWCNGILKGMCFLFHYSHCEATVPIESNDVLWNDTGKLVYEMTIKLLNYCCEESIKFSMKDFSNIPDEANYIQSQADKLIEDCIRRLNSGDKSEISVIKYQLKNSTY